MTKLKMIGSKILECLFFLSVAIFITAIFCGVMIGIIIGLHYIGENIL